MTENPFPTKGELYKVRNLIPWVCTSDANSLEKISDVSNSEWVAGKLGVPEDTFLLVLDSHPEGRIRSAAEPDRPAIERTFDLILVLATDLDTMHTKKILLSIGVGDWVVFLEKVG